MPFYGDETGEVFSVKEAERPKLETYTHSFETQSGFLVIVKPIGNVYSLSFKRQLGTPPTSFVTLTPDEARRLSNLLGPKFQPEAAEAYAEEMEMAEYSFAKHAPKYGKNSFGGPLAVIIGTMTLLVVIAIVTYQIKFHTGQ
jgi:K+/H+ antiporter YhaU regulatory subunit KhtT